MNNTIETFGLSKSFRGIFRQTEALHAMDLAVPEGSVYGLVGPNGAGKTTAIKLLMNIHAPSRGRGQVMGVDSTRLAPA
ncbi:MAG: ATP-binding cassette domain-containing protein [Acidobacteriia bacterium]|nr:ATP-binding cassette domain-containing protein [Terriglobia bacterium]